jgi:hypothetical protein
MRNNSANGFYAVVLEEMDGARRLQIVIGASEAHAIECVLCGIKPPRPLTHDLYVNTLNEFAINVESVVIKLLTGGVYAATILASDGIRTVSLDSRSSDALAIAVRLNVPIYASEEMLDAVGMKMPASHASTRTQSCQKEKSINEDSTEAIKDMSDEQLRMRIKEAARTEHYELASLLKSELDRRKNENVDNNINVNNLEEENKHEKS